MLTRAHEALQEVWLLADDLKMTKTALSLSYCLSFPQVSTVIPGIKTAEQVDQNTAGIEPIGDVTLQRLRLTYSTNLAQLVERMEKQG